MKNFNKSLEKNVEINLQPRGNSEKSQSSHYCENADVKVLSEDATQSTDSGCEPRDTIVDNVEQDSRHEDGNISDNEHNPAENQISYITMKIVAFLNARHYMVFADKKGKTHGHSWQLQAEARVPVRYDSFLKFEDLDKLLNKLLTPYQRNVLNEVYPFDIIEPLTENISAYFFNTLSDALNNLEVELVKLTVWENPTKGIEITERLPQYFSSQDHKSVPVSVVCESIIEAAITSDTDDSALLNIADTERAVEQSTDMLVPGEMAEPSQKIQGNTEPNNSSQSGGNNVQGQQTTIFAHDNGKILNSLKHDNVEPEGDLKTVSYPLWKILISILILTGAAIWAYWPIISAPLSQAYPYGYDSWCHLLKTEFLVQEIQQGNIYPHFFQYWHNGVEPFRYWGPLSYYAMALAYFITQNIFTATNLYIFACALLGGIAWLVFSKRIGLIQATAGGIIWIFWVDNLKEAFRVGNYPRLLAICILPLLTECFLRVLEEKRYLFPMIICVVSIHMVVLCHAMIAAIYCVSLMMVAIFLWLNNGIQLKSVIRGGLTLTLGILSSSWWLIPSLKGGVVGFTQEAAGGAVRFVTVNEAFNPISMVAANYMGISLVVAIALILLFWRSYPKWAKALSLCGILLILLSLPQFKAIQNALPLHHLLWPLRFSSFWSLALILAVLSLPDISKARKYVRVNTSKIIIAIVFLCLFLDSYHSLTMLGHTVSESLSYKVGSISGKLIDSTLPESDTLKPVFNSIGNYSGWRVATLDISRLGSSPSFFLTHDLNREQVFGWAWQGAQTANNVMLLNTALEKGWYPFLLQRIGYMGGTDLLTLDSRINNYEEFAKIAQEAGYSNVFKQGAVSHWHGLNKPYLPVIKKECLAIGKYASIYAMQFPSLVIGNSIKVDDYTLDQLKQYKVIVLTGIDWSSRDAAEKLIKKYAISGGRVIVDLNGFPNDVLSRQPMFLGVYGEPISLTGSLDISTGQEKSELLPFDMKDWRAISPQHLDTIEIAFPHYGNKAALIGSRRLPDVPAIYYIGANLAYHCFLTHDPAGIKILENVLQVPSNYTPNRVIELTNYMAQKDGYSMVYDIKEDCEVIIPVAALDGMQAYIDGDLIQSSVCENLVQMTLPAGKHSLDIKLHKDSIYKFGEYISLFAITLVIGWIYLLRRGRYRLRCIS